MRNELDNIQQLSNLIQFSPKRRDLLERLRLSFDLAGAALRLSCPTRWTTQTKFFESVLHNYKAFLETLFFIAVGNDGVTCLEVTTEASEIHAKLEMFDLILVIAVCTKLH